MVEKLRARGDVDGLARALAYEDPITDRDGEFVDLGAPVRVEAVTALGEIGDPGARDALATSLDDPEGSVRAAAIRALSRQPQPGDVQAIAGAVAGWKDQTFAEAREEALNALCVRRDPDGPRALATALLNRDDFLTDVDREALLRVIAASGLGPGRVAVGELIASLAREGATWRARTMLAWLSPASVAPLLAALRDPQLRREAALALGATRDARAVEPLCELLQSDADPTSRAAAAAALGEIRHPAAVRALLEATADADYAVRTEAIAAFDLLGNVGVAVATRMLMGPALENGASSVESVAVQMNGASQAPEFPHGGPVLRRLLRRGAET